jgi:hypothetical protein
MTKLSIPKYIEELGLPQLERIVELATNKINKIKEEEKFTVWRVCDSRFCLGNFRQEDFGSAVECLINEIKYYAEKFPNSDISIILEGQKEHKSEYESYFE